MRRRQRMAIKQVSFNGNTAKVKEVKVNGEPTVSRRFGEAVWKNERSIPIKSITAIVPYPLLGKLASIETKMHSTVEFGAYIKGHLNETGDILIVEDDIYIPKQEVSSATVDFQEDEPEGFNGVIHRHPNGINNFSSTDDTFINSNYDFSLLYVNGDVRCGIINLKVGDFRYQMSLRIQHGGYEDIDVGNITMRYVAPSAAAMAAAGVHFPHGSIYKPGFSKKKHKSGINGSILDVAGIQDLPGFTEVNPDDDADDDNVPSFV